MTKLFPFHRLARISLAFVMLASIVGSGSAGSPIAAASANSCQLPSATGNVQHVVFIQFDNVHFTRDNPNVPSDLEQMPNLLNFMTGNGVLLSQEHTPLISHTADDILTSLTGVYGDRHGMPIANTYRYFNPNGTSTGAGSFAYWTDLVDSFSPPSTDTTYNLVDQNGHDAPAPWVPYTRAGCNVGSVAVANTSLENLTPDVATIFGANSSQEQEVKTNPDQASADFIGIAVHCASNSTACSTANGGVADVLPNEPGGYSGFNGLFGHTYVAPIISPNGPLTDLNGSPIPGFPGFDGMIPAVSLAYVASLQEHGVPVTFAYVSTAHESAQTGTPFGPGQAEYVANLKTYDQAFGQFFSRLASDGIDASNTLFVITADEGDHFIGGAPAPAGCDGVTTPCTYSQIGELDANVTGLLATQQAVTTTFSIHSDMAPNFYLTGNPGSTASATRSFERALGHVTVTNPLLNTMQNLSEFMADPIEMKLLHMVTSDPARTPTFTMFAQPDYFVIPGAKNCNSPCVFEESGFAWNHGGVSPDVNTTWLGLVGPGVRKLGVDDKVWSDHTDIRPTMLALVGLKDDYQHQGRVLLEVLDPQALPKSLNEHRGDVINLAEAYKQIDAPVGPLGLASLAVSTRATASGSSTDDSTYTKLDGQLAQITTERDNLANQMEQMLEDAAFANQSIDVAQAHALTVRADDLLQRVANLAGG